jgi:hypothetical protein
MKDGCFSKPLDATLTDLAPNFYGAISKGAVIGSTATLLVSILFSLTAY